MGSGSRSRSLAAAPSPRAPGPAPCIGRTLGDLADAGLLLVRERVGIELHGRARELLALPGADGRAAGEDEEEEELAHQRSSLRPSSAKMLDRDESSVKPG